MTIFLQLISGFSLLSIENLILISEYSQIKKNSFYLRLHWDWIVWHFNIKRCPNALCFERRATIWIKAETEEDIRRAEQEGGREGWSTCRGGSSGSSSFSVDPAVPGQWSQSRILCHLWLPPPTSALCLLSLSLKIWSDLIIIDHIYH